MLGIAWRDGDRLTKPGKGTRGGRKTRDPNSPSQCYYVQHPWFERQAKAQTNFQFS